MSLPSPINIGESSVNSKRIAFNTFLLYGRMMIVMAINLYTVRMVLKALGVEDYGIYTVVAGIVTMLQSVSNVMSTATHRYYSYSIGEKDYENLKAIFSTSITIYVIFSMIVLLLGETIGLWIVNTQLVIPDSRIEAANWVYQFSLLSFIFTMFSLPYSSATIAHEHMNVFAVVSLVECLLKFLMALLLPTFLFDRLIVYGASFVVIALISFISYLVICRRNYQECRFEKPSDGRLFKGMLSFFGWSLFSSFASIGMNQVGNVFTNVFFGPVVNASRAIAFQINGAMSSFTGSFLMALKPPMIKAYAEGSYHYLNKMFYLSNKLIYSCLLMAIIPLCLEMENVLLCWLDTSDAQTTLFSRLILIYVLIMALNNPISIVIQATGRIRNYNIYVEFFTLMCMPATYICFRLGFPASSAFIVMIISAVFSHIVRLVCLKKYYPMYNNSVYLKSFVVPTMLITGGVLLLTYGTYDCLSSGLLRFFVVLAVSVISTILFSFMGLSRDERNFVKKFFHKIIKKISL